jgi:hypothetical protein
MGQWLIADVSLLDVHLQLWMLLVIGIMLLWITCGRAIAFSGLALPYRWRQSSQRPRSTKRGYHGEAHDMHGD